jgi:hypothetical protein
MFAATLAATPPINATQARVLPFRPARCRVSSVILAATIMPSMEIGIR